MSTTSRVTKSDVVVGSWRGHVSRHSLLQQMAQDAEKLQAQGERLRALKKAAGRSVTFRKIAAACDVTDRQAQRWFSGESDPEPDNLKALAKFMGTTQDYIEYGTVKGKPVTGKAPNGKTPDVMGALATELDSGQLQRVEDKLDALTDWITELDGRFVAAGLLQAVETDGESTPATDRTKRPKRAA